MDKTIGVLGGGQLGRMLTEAANRLNVKILTLDAEGSSAKQINSTPDHVTGSFTDPSAILRLAQRSDILTVEIEHVNTDVLEDLCEGSEIRDDWRGVHSTEVEVQPSWRTLRVIQDKFKQKKHLFDRSIDTARCLPLETGTLEEVEEIGKKLGYPLMLKSRTEAYDGRGNCPVSSLSDVPAALVALKNRPLYAEQWVNFKAELAVMVVKTRDIASDDEWRTATLPYPVVEAIHEDSICKLVYAPARNVPEGVMHEAQDLARRAVAGFWGRGVFGVEMFLLDSGKLLVNEIAPRPHNSGHYSIEACPISQYDAQIRAILGLPIPLDGTSFLTPDTNAVMLNILGGAQPDSHLAVAEAALSIPGARIHMYGKGAARPGRKMGHVTVVAGSMAQAQRQIKPLIELVDKIRAERQRTPPLIVARTLDPIEPTSSTPTKTPLVAITMGSESDRHVLEPGIELLKQLGISHLVTITSAHRTPEKMFKFAREAASKGFRIIIAAAGGAAHLPGMIAALTSLPVIGVPVKASVLDGMDSLLSIVQMPRGCPVAAVAINNSNNAAQLAARILATTDVTIRQRLQKYLADQTKAVDENAQKKEIIWFNDDS